MTASATFPERLPSKNVAQFAPVCQVEVVAIKDARRSPETLGVVAGKAIKSPTDREAWLRSLAAGLGSRGYRVVFAAPEDASSDVRLSIVLKSAWLSDVSSNKVANVVLSVAGEGANRQHFMRDYRGDITRVNWNSTDEELQKLTNAAFDLALDKIGHDLRALCVEP